MEHGDGMTEQILDALRPLAVTIEDEGSRLRRSLKGSSANEEQVREHLQNCLKACEAAKAAIDPPSVKTIELSVSALTKSAAEVLMDPPVFPVLTNDRPGRKGRK